MALTGTVRGARDLRALRHAFERRHAPLADRPALAVLVLLGLYVGGGLAWWLFSLPSTTFACADPIVRDPACTSAWGWTVVAIAVAAGTASARTAGPVTCGAETAFWLLSTPVDRGAALRPRVAALLICGAIAGALVGRFATFVTAPEGRVAFTCLAAALGVGAVALPMLVQCRVLAPAVVRVVIGLCLVAVPGVVTVAAVGVAVSPPGPLFVVGAWIVVAAPAVSVLRRCGRIAAPEWRVGSDTAVGASAALTALDPSLLTGVVERKAWLRIGSRHSRPLPRHPTAALVRSDLLRHVRRPAPALVACVALLGVAVAVSVASPPAAAVVQLVTVFTMATILATGLRDVSRDPDFAVLFGTRDTHLRLALSVVPGSAAVVAGAVTGFVGSASVASVVIGLAGGCAAAYRMRTRPPIGYDGLLLETAVGQIPVDLLRQWARGPDLLVVCAWLVAVIA
ncbi:DUF6297 family protein [Rhodococcus rhodochrous]|uniref:DUF6297 family protein n=1 Tax=Rhodococcus rhodochrous TaxID=1829 RepID=UPI00036A1A61|nr:DUF6297 family protein [Rhodococcus rhodochrous]MCR8690949.1 DUF6297 family protein [Rhodococcus pyridinivorans]MXQ75312.1 ABC transporter permease [Rhodococcus rhodochrous]